MKVRDAIERLGRMQRRLGFKLVASGVVLAAAVAFSAWYLVAVTAPGAPAAPAVGPDAPEELRSLIDSTQRMVAEVLAKREDPTNVVLGAAVLAGIALVVVWIGLGLTYLALLAGALAVVVPITLWTPWTGAARLGVGVLALTAALTALIEGLRLAMSLPLPVFAVARNVLVEAVRMKISLVFIVLLVFGLAALPGLLNESSPLRYRVQSFLQYGVGGSYWVLALLTVFFSAATVAFEQRDRQIWQTMTKPVAPWEYVLGKWLGVASLNAALLATCAAGIFLFTEYLRQQPAHGEGAMRGGAAMIDVGEGRQVSQDRFILETQVLAARASTGPVRPISLDDPGFQNAVDEYVRNENRGRAPGDLLPFDRTSPIRRKLESDLFKGVIQSFFAVGPGEARTYVFDGLEDARRIGRSLVLRYRVDAGANLPDQIYRLMVVLAGRQARREEVGLGHTHTLWPIDPGLIQIVETEDGRRTGRLEITIVNGEWVLDEQGQAAIAPNPETISLPEDALRLTYPVATFQGNFLRAVVILWAKLAAISMVAIVAASFLGFPVACLVAMGALLSAEGAVFLSSSLEVFRTEDHEGRVIVVKKIIEVVARVISWAFSGFAKIKPAEALVDGRLISWLHVLGVGGWLGTTTAGLYAAGVGILRRRELALYSGN